MTHTDKSKSCYKYFFASSPVWWEESNHHGLVATLHFCQHYSELFLFWKVLAFQANVSCNAKLNRMKWKVCIIHLRYLSTIHSTRLTVCPTLSNAVNVVFVSFVNVMFVFKWAQKTKTEKSPSICSLWQQLSGEVFEYCKSNNAGEYRY